MRYKFRGQKGSTKEWVYGGIDIHGGFAYIMVNGEFVLVDAKTVGQFTGIKDRNGVEIYEGCKLTNNGWNAVIYWDAKCCWFYLKYTDEKMLGYNPRLNGLRTKEVEVIGHIFEDNKNES